MNVADLDRELLATPARPRPKRAVRLLIADHGPTRLGIRMALDGVASVCAEAGNAAQAISAAERTKPDVCVIGLEIPGGGMRAVQGICAVAPDANVILMAARGDAEQLLAAVHTGAIGYLPGNTAPGALRRVVLAAARGEASIPRAMVVTLTRELRGMANADERLTAREAQVLALLRKGQSTAAIAEGLAISPITVRRHISSLAKKIGVESRAALAVAEVPASARESIGAIA